MNGEGSREIRGVSNLNSEVTFSRIPGFCPEATMNTYKPVVHPDHGLFAIEDRPPNRRQTLRRHGCSSTDVSRAISGDGFCTNDLPRKFVQYRNMPDGACRRVLSHEPLAKLQQILQAFLHIAYCIMSMLLIEKRHSTFGLLTLTNAQWQTTALNSASGRFVGLRHFGALSSPTLSGW